MPSEQMTQPLPWVGTLSQSHKKIIMDNKELCSDIIYFAQSILKKQFPDINGFQDTTLAPIKLNDKWISNNSFQTQSHPSLQIHHTVPVNGQKVTGQKVTKLLGQKVTIYIFYPGGQKVTTYIFA